MKTKVNGVYLANPVADENFSCNVDSITCFEHVSTESIKYVLNTRLNHAIIRSKGFIPSYRIKSIKQHEEIKDDMLTVFICVKVSFSEFERDEKYYFRVVEDD